MKKSPKYLKHSKKFRLEISVFDPSLCNSGNQIISSTIIDKPNYDFSDLTMDLNHKVFLEDQYFNFSPKDLVLKLKIEEVEKCQNILIRVTYCDYGNVQLGPGEIDWAFCDLVIS